MARRAMCVAQSRLWKKCVVSGAPKRIRKTVKSGEARRMVRSKERSAGYSRV